MELNHLAVERKRNIFGASAADCLTFLRAMGWKRLLSVEFDNIGRVDRSTNCCDASSLNGTGTLARRVYGSGTMHLHVHRRNEVSGSAKICHYI